jgi:hypothetical protein
MSEVNRPDEVADFFVDLEGTIYPWHQNTITVPEIRTLGGWEANQEVVEVNLEENTEVTLLESAIIELKPGHGFDKKIKFQRG